MQSKDYPQACQKFEASQKLDEGIGTLLYLADCYEKTNRTASAWAMFKEAASIAGAQNQESRQKLALQRAKALETRLVRLVIDVPKGNTGLLGFEVRNDGLAVPPAQFGVPVPVDPGEHRIDASAPGRRTFVEVVKMGSTDGRTSIPLLEELPAASAASTPTPEPQTVTVTPTTTSMLPQTTVEDSSNGRNQRTISYFMGTAGIVGVGIGTYFGLAAIHNHNASKSTCVDSICHEQRLGEYNDAVSQARVSTVAFLAGGALLASGLVLYLTAPENKSHAVQATAMAEPNGAHFALRGEW